MIIIEVVQKILVGNKLFSSVDTAHIFKVAYVYIVYFIKYTAERLSFAPV